jgi:hypothetical protein
MAEVVDDGGAVTMAMAMVMKTSAAQASEHGG